MSRPAETFRDFSDSALGRSCVGHIDLDRFGLAASGRDAFDDLLRCVRAAHVSEDDVGALAREDLCRRSSNAPRGASDDCYFSAEVEHEYPVDVESARPRSRGTVYHARAAFNSES